MSKLRILIADDDALIAMLLNDLLTGMGHEVCAIADTQTGIVTEAMRTSPDLMIVDANLHDGGSGVSAVEQILGNHFIPHFFVTGDPLGVETIMPGATVIPKPYTLYHLMQGIDQALGRNPTTSIARTGLTP